MKARISWQFGGDSILVTDGTGETIASADGGHAKRVIFDALARAGISPRGRRLNDDYGQNNPAPLGAERFWDFEAEVSDATVDELRAAQRAVEAEQEAIHQEALERLRENGIRGLHLDDESIAEAVRARLAPWLSVVGGNTRNAVYLTVPPENLTVSDPPDGSGLTVAIRAPVEWDAMYHFFEEYNSLAKQVLSHLQAVRNLCYHRPRRRS